MYCTVEDVLLGTGYQPESFSYLGEKMTLCQFTQMVEMFIEEATTEINRYCNVLTFEEHEVTNELHTLSGFDMADYRTGFYTPARIGTQFFTEVYSDVTRTIYPREQPVREVSKVEVNKNLNYDQGPQWKLLYQYGIEYEGGIIGNDYDLIDKFETLSVYFLRNFPTQGKNNVRITYKAGYPSTDPIWSVLRAACRLAVRHALETKFEAQQNMTMYNTGVSTYSNLFHMEKSKMSEYLTPDVTAKLDRYRVPALPIDMWD